MDDLQKCFKVKYCSGTNILSAKNKLLLSSVLIILNNSSGIIGSSDLLLLKAADWQNAAILWKENSSGTYVSRKIREAEGFSDLLQCVLPTNFPQGLIQSPL